MAGRVRAGRTRREAAGETADDREALERAAALRSVHGASFALQAYNPYRVKIYTRTGDAGQTSLFDNTRVSKADSRVDAYGAVDELSAWLGLVRSSGLDEDFDEAIVRVQRDLFALGAQIADPADRIATRVTKVSLGDADVARLEDEIDRLETGLPPLSRFIVAGGSPVGAALHVARTVCRRAERRIVALAPPADPVLLRYINRLSDLLFVLARAANHRAHVAETEW
jgi:cob(I)alamin adenosyltransferase